MAVIAVQLPYMLVVQGTGSGTIQVQDMISGGLTLDLLPALEHVEIMLQMVLRSQLQLITGFLTRGKR